MDGRTNFQQGPIVDALAKCVSTFGAQLGGPTMGTLTQVWLPEPGEDGCVELNTQGMPFSINGSGDLLALFRCISCKYKFSTNTTKPLLLGAVGRVYTSGEPEMSHDVQKYDQIVYPRVAEAQRCHVHSSMFLPVYDSSRRDSAIAVLEAVQTHSNTVFPALVEWATCCLQSVGLYTAEMDKDALPIGLRTVVVQPEYEASAFESGVGALPLGVGVGFRGPSGHNNNNVVFATLSENRPGFGGAGNGAAGSAGGGLSYNGGKARSMPPPPLPHTSSAGNGAPASGAGGGFINGNNPQTFTIEQFIPATHPAMMMAAAAMPSSTTVLSDAVHVGGGGGGVGALLPPVKEEQEAEDDDDDAVGGQPTPSKLAVPATSNGAVKHGGGSSTGGGVPLPTSAAANGNAVPVQQQHEYNQYNTRPAKRQALSGPPATATTRPTTTTTTLPLNNNGTISNGVNGVVTSTQQQQPSSSSQLLQVPVAVTVETQTLMAQAIANQSQMGGGTRDANGVLTYGQGDRVWTLDDLQLHFGKSLKDAAAALGICTTTLKRACRRLGLAKWPRRELQRLQAQAQTAQTIGIGQPQQQESLVVQQQQQQQQKSGGGGLAVDFTIVSGDTISAASSGGVGIPALNNTNNNINMSVTAAAAQQQQQQQQQQLLLARNGFNPLPLPTALQDHHQHHLLLQQQQPTTINHTNNLNTDNSLHVQHPLLPPSPGGGGDVAVASLRPGGTWPAEPALGVGVGVGGHIDTHHDDLEHHHHHHINGSVLVGVGGPDSYDGSVGGMESLDILAAAEFDMSVGNDGGGNGGGRSEFQYVDSRFGMYGGN